VDIHKPGTWGPFSLRPAASAFMPEGGFVAEFALLAAHCYCFEVLSTLIEQQKNISFNLHD
jgi:hypothetical protein